MACRSPLAQLLTSLLASVLAGVQLLPAVAGAQGFNGLYTQDGLDVVAVGDSGASYRTLDGGLTWTARIIGAPTRSLRDVAGRGLTLLVVGDAGMIWVSRDGGGHWSSTQAAGAPQLRAAAIVSDSVWVVAGSGGTILRTIDAGANWSATSSPTAHTFNAVRFTAARTGWAAGDGGALLRTADGGGAWTVVPLGTTNALESVDQRGTRVWAVGADGAAWRSTNGGTSFAPLNLALDARADVNCVTMLSPDTLWLAGGGGFIRSSTDGGASWTFQQHPLQAPPTRVIAFGTGVWVANANNRVVLSTTNLGATWRMPAGATVTRAWAGKLSTNGQARGNGFALNPVYKRTLYCGLGAEVTRSRDDGDSWQVAASFPAGYSKCNAFLVSPRDSNLWLAAVGAFILVISVIGFIRQQLLPDE